MMKNSDTRKEYDLISRTQQFAKKTSLFLSKIPKTLSNIEEIKQLTRASGSVVANYVEAYDSLSKKDFYYRIRICRKEAKESVLFLSLIDTGPDEFVDNDRVLLIKEGTELMKIFGSIVTEANNQV